MRYFGFIIVIFLFNNVSFSQNQAFRIQSPSLPSIKKEFAKDGSDFPAYIEFYSNKGPLISNINSWFTENFETDASFGLELISVQTDKIGLQHYRYMQTSQGFPLRDAVLVVHSRDGRIQSMNGNIKLKNVISNSIIRTEEQALSSALTYVGASRYMWEEEGQNEFLRNITDNPEATYYPEGRLMILSKNKELRYAWEFNIYASYPLSRAFVYVDAENAQIIYEDKIIKTADAVGTAVTGYSGNRTITADSYQGQYRLRETGRGNGIETYDMNMGTNYNNAVDFVDGDNYWDNANAQLDQYAGDAHWATEMTYDYFYLNHGRNSIDGSGLKLMSFIHFDLVASGYPSNVNAFWNGQVMTYGDGSSTYSPLTTVDICAHEITHGLTSYTANLDYSYESGAINEGFSDIFGTAVEYYAKGVSGGANWLIGEDIGGAFRSLANPKAYQLPDTYLGQYWYAGSNDNGGVHTNCGVLMHWFYLVSEGGSGTNDIGSTYNVTGIGMQKAEDIAFRMLTVYLINTSQYADARFYAIQSAIDLYGPCSNEVQAVTDAMYAVGIGNQYVAGVQADFTADFTEFCTFPATVTFSNQSNNATSYTWDFGDGSTSTQNSPSHTYTAFGDYTVKLYADGGSCGNDSLIETAYISVQPNNPCIFFMANQTLDHCNGKLYDDGGGDFYSNNTNYTTTIAPTGASQIIVDFISFDVEEGSGGSTLCDYDYVSIYDGPSTSSNLIGTYCNTTGPPPSFTSSGGAVTIVQHTDGGLTMPGFEMHWQCLYPNAAPNPGFTVSDTSTCTGIIQFNDESLNGPTSWYWDFGDGNTSNLQSPVHAYSASGTYTVKLVVSNQFGADSAVQLNIVHVNLPPTPQTTSGFICVGGQVQLSGAGSGMLEWYDSPSGGTALDTGNNFTTPYLSQSQTFYVQDVLNGLISYGAKTDNSGGGGYFGNAQSQHHLNFDAYVPFILKSVKVYADGAGSRTIQLRNSSGQLIQELTTNIPDGESRVILNFNVPVGTGLQLRGAGSPDLYRNNSGCTYPYTTAGIFSITSSSANSNPTGYYYFFYDWEVQEESCFSARIPVQAEVHQVDASISPAGNTSFCIGTTISLTASNGDAWSWLPNGEITQSINVSAPGSFRVIVFDSICSDTSNQTIVYAAGTVPQAGFSISITDPSISITDTSYDAVNYYWDFGDGYTSTLSDPNHTYQQNGIFIITQIVSNGCGSDTISDTIQILTVGMLNQGFSGLSVFPNPANDHIQINFFSNSTNEIVIQLVDITGRVIYSEKKSIGIGKQNMSLDTKSLAPGFYLVKLQSDNTEKTKKIIIKH